MNYIVVPRKCAPATVYLKPESTVFSQGDRAGSLYLVKSGCIVICRVTRSGHRLVAEFVFPGEVFGWEVARDHQYSAQSAGCSAIQTFLASQTEELQRTTLSSSFNLLREEHLVVSRPSAEARVAAFLENLLLRQGGVRQIRLPMHRFDIAAYLGLSPETVSRVLHRFMKNEVIAMPDLHTIIVVDRALLKLASRLESD